MKDEELIARWDIHTVRQIEAAKGGILAVTVLNSGSWLILLSQVDKLLLSQNGADLFQKLILFWGFGAFFGTAAWIFVYLSALAQSAHDFDSEKIRYQIALELSRYAGLAFVLIALGLFIIGVVVLSNLTA